MSKAIKRTLQVVLLGVLVATPFYIWPVLNSAGDPAGVCTRMGNKWDTVSQTCNGRPPTSEELSVGKYIGSPEVYTQSTIYY